MVVAHGRAARVTNLLDELAAQLNRFVNMPVQGQVGLAIFDERAHAARADMPALSVGASHPREQRAT